MDCYEHIDTQDGDRISMSGDGRTEIFMCLTQGKSRNGRDSTATFLTVEQLEEHITACRRILDLYKVQA